MAALWLLPAGGLSQAQGTPAPGGVETPAFPATPQELFAAVAKDARPQWRTCFSEKTREVSGDRSLAALALGAAVADCYLAAEARDAQQLRNMVMDMAGLEKILSIHRQLDGGRQRLTELAGAGEWKGLREGIAGVLALHTETLTGQRDEALVELESLGLWLRSLQISAQHTQRMTKAPERACVWSAAFVASLSARATAAAEKDAKSAGLKSLAENMEKLKTLWPGESPPANAAERVAATVELLDMMAEQLFFAGSIAPN